MASIRKEIDVDVVPAKAWDAIRDVGAAHTRLFPGALSDCRLEGDVRVVTFSNGMVVREPIVSVDDGQMRFAWTAVGGRATHYNASLQVFANGDGGSRVVWIVDVLPNEIAGAIEGIMTGGSAAMKATLER
ncbi:MAG: SRPBCC family protein [Candidatus Aquilonibacter sp.]